MRGQLVRGAWQGLPPELAGSVVLSSSQESGKSGRSAASMVPNQGEEGRAKTLNSAVSWLMKRYGFLCNAVGTAQGVLALCRRPGKT